jgi:hypothetical protein
MPKMLAQKESGSCKQARSDQRYRFEDYHQAKDATHKNNRHNGEKNDRPPLPQCLCRLLNGFTSLYHASLLLFKS